MSLHYTYIYIPYIYIYIYIYMYVCMYVCMYVYKVFKVFYVLSNKNVRRRFVRRFVRIEI